MLVGFPVVLWGSKLFYIGFQFPANGLVIENMFLELEQAPCNMLLEHMQRGDFEGVSGTKVGNLVAVLHITLHVEIVCNQKN